MVGQKKHAVTMGVILGLCLLVGCQFGGGRITEVTPLVASPAGGEYHQGQLDSLGVLTSPDEQIVGKDEKSDVALQKATEPFADRCQDAASVVVEALDSILPAELGNQRAVSQADEGAVTDRTHTWVQEHTEHVPNRAWKTLVLDLIQKDLSVGMSRAALESIRDHLQTAWQALDKVRQAEVPRKTEQVCPTEEERLASEEADRKRRETELVRQHQEESPRQKAALIKAETISLPLRAHMGPRALHWVAFILVIIMGSLGYRFWLSTQVEPTGPTRACIETQSITLQPPPERTGPSRTQVQRQGTATPQKTRPLLGESWTIPVLGLGLVYVVPGSFQMGSNDGNKDEKPVHAVKISQRFWMGKHQ
ncbi:MAG: hypothetical protein GY809_02790, partial [Planctomycetes bacterium]|nr:hypothetical protein [Planctomycetota bacterium]